MKRLLIILLILSLSSPNNIDGQSVTQSRHNLSVTDGSNINKKNDSEICIYCHTSHSSNPKAPLWNRNETGAIYTLYDSSTLNARPGQPDGTSILCLSCHDGTVALGNTLSTSDNRFSKHYVTNGSDLGTDLSDDHPISFQYDMALTESDIELRDPYNLPQNILDVNGKLQCTSCHDSHKDLEGNFLKRSLEFSELCFSCHDTKYWGSSSHNLSTNTWNKLGQDPWLHLDDPYSSVSQNGCSNCHDTHNAPKKERLLKRITEEGICLDCHNGNVADTKMAEEFTKPYRHNVYAYNDIHDPMEDNINSLSRNNSKHVECVDCHNPHASNSTSGNAPFISGANLGVNGVDQRGSQVDVATNTYEVCFKCHADNPVTSEYTTRYLGETNVRKDFDPNNISFHPVIEKGNNLNPRGLVLPYNASSVLYCSSCHASDNPNAPSGPHGSIYPRILKANYNMEKTPQLGKNWPVLMQSNFALCFECHEVNAVTDIHMNMSGGHFMETIGCNTCHDPHGFQGGTYSENRFGINFDRTVIQPNPWNGKMIDLDQKKCFMTCHDPRGVVNYTHSPGGDDY